MDQFLHPCGRGQAASYASGLFGCRGEVLDEREFSAGLELTKVDLIHEGADEEDAAASAAKKIFGCERIGQVFPIDAFTLVGDRKDKGFAVVLKAGCDLLGRVVVVAMKDGIDGCFADGHRNAEALVFVDARLRG